ncbi:hypothetical protein ACFLWX_03155 [Chloroflexota bacterium]
MSKLVDKLKTTAEGAVPAIGFRVTAKSVKPAPILLIAKVAGGRGIDDVAKSGVDAVLFAKSDSGKMQDVVTKAGDIPCGVILGNVNGGEIAELKESGCDFLVSSPVDAPVSVLKEEGLGKILRIPVSLEMSTIRGIGRIGADAILLVRDEEKDYITIQFLMACHFMGDAVRKPLMAEVPAGIGSDDITVLWEAGVDGLVIESSGKRLKELRKVINSLPSAAKRRRGGEAALIPRPSESMTMLGEDDEDEDENETGLQGDV